MDSQSIARLLTAGLAPPSGADDTGQYTGVILTWDELSGVNSVSVNGVTMSNLRVIQSGIGLTYQPGDSVIIQRKGTQYYIQGRVGAPGAGAANQIRSAQVDDYHNVGTPSSPWGDLPSYGPEVTSVYIGSTRRCLVFLSAYLAGNTSMGNMSFQVSGASSISPDTKRAARLGSADPGNVSGVSTRVCLLTANEGLNQGFNTFTAKYWVQLVGGTGAEFANRNLTVIPF